MNTIVKRKRRAVNGKSTLEFTVVGCFSMVWVWNVKDARVSSEGLSFTVLWQCYCISAVSYKEFILRWYLIQRITFYLPLKNKLQLKHQQFCELCWCIWYLNVWFQTQRIDGGVSGSANAEPSSRSAGRASGHLCDCSPVFYCMAKVLFLLLHKNQPGVWTHNL